MAAIAGGRYTTTGEISLVLQTWKVAFYIMGGNTHTFSM